MRETFLKWPPRRFGLFFFLAIMLENCLIIIAYASICDHIYSISHNKSLNNARAVAKK